jgi:cytochrome b6-f complex iron-sulfur subunit
MTTPVTHLSYGGHRLRQDLSRRKFLSYAWWGAFGLMTATTVGAIGSYFWPNLRTTGFGAKINIGQASALPPVGSVTYFADAQFYVSHVPEGIIAMWRKCPHLGCVVPWEPGLASLDTIEPTGRFACPCHNSQYDRYGVIKSGPAPRPLDWFPIERNPDGTLSVDTGRVNQRPQGLDIATQVFRI